MILENNHNDFLYKKLDLATRWKSLERIKSSKKTIEDAISELTNKIKVFKRSYFLSFVSQYLRTTNNKELEVYKNLMSPMRQLIYLIDLYVSIEEKGDKEFCSEREWEEITMILDEIELIYFSNIGFVEGYEKEENFVKISSSLQSFLNYFFNGQLSYDEQTLDRLYRYCGKFNIEIESEFGFTIKDADIFMKHIKTLEREKYYKCGEYRDNKKWQSLTAKFIDRGLKDPKDWIDEPELVYLKKLMTIPAYLFIIQEKEIYESDLPHTKTKKIIEFLTYTETERDIVYYASKNTYEKTPLIKLNTKEYLCPQIKFSLESFYNRINTRLSELKEEKYTQYKNRMFENKVFEIFKKLFGNDTQYFTSYYFDKKKSEQDLLILFKGFLLIIEIKDVSFREPMRDPFRAYKKIKKDFETSIQSGYEQCLRVEKKLEDNLPFEIYDIDSQKKLYKIIPNRIKNYFSIVVTQYKYGNIQTNLETLLVKQEDALYPWSVCVDDLEAFVLLLKKLKKGGARTDFINFLKHREAFNEHLICTDELELCALFINTPKKFEKLSVMDETINCDPRMSEIFDFEYRNGLGFENEIDIELKKKLKVPKYEKVWDFDVIKGEDLFKMHNI